MLEKLAGEIISIAKPEETKIGSSVVQKIKSDLVRVPKSDVFVSNPTSILLKNEINCKNQNISDSKIVEYIKKNNSESASSSTLEKLNDVLDVYHTFNEKYSCIGSWGFLPKNQEYYQYVKKNPSVFPGGKEKLLSQFKDSIEASEFKSKSFIDRLKSFCRKKTNHVLNKKELLSQSKGLIEAIDFRNESRLDRLKAFCMENPNHELANHFYNEYYLKSDLVQSNLKEKCSEINKKFGVKVFLSSNYSQNESILNYIEKELAELERASEGQVKKLDVLDLSTINKGYIDDNAAHGCGKSGGYGEGNKISLKGSKFSNVSSAFRHELTHIYDTKNGSGISKQYIREIMPKKEILNDNLDIVSVLDFDKCKYVEEFYNAGISQKYVQYAYTNPKEFIAVASEGDMSKYSPEFKQVLIDFGMPEWMFKMRPKDETVKESIVGTI